MRLSTLTSNKCEVGGINPKMRGGTCPYLCTCAFASCVRNKNTKENTLTQKTPSEKKCSQLIVCAFPYLSTCYRNHSLNKEYIYLEEPGQGGQPT